MDNVNSEKNGLDIGKIILASFSLSVFLFCFIIIPKSCSTSDSLLDDLNKKIADPSKIQSINIYGDSSNRLVYSVALVDKREILHFIKILRNSSNEGHTPKNHPRWIKEGNIRIVFENKEFYRIYFDVYAYKDYKYTSLTSFPKGLEKAFILPKNYENRELGEYLDNLISKTHITNAKPKSFFDDIMECVKDIKHLFKELKARILDKKT